MKKLRFLAVFLLLLFAGCGCKDLPSATPEPLATPSPTPYSVIKIEPLNPTPTPEPLYPEEGIYTIAWLSDTQYYSRSFPETFLTMTAFLRDNRSALKLGYVVHTGDIVHNYNKDAEWEIAAKAMAALRDIPHGVLAGNHDVGTSKKNYRYFSQYFGDNYTRSFPWYGGGYEENRGHYDLITMGNTDYLFVYMGYAPNSACIEWLNETFAAYPNRVGILCLHEYLDSDMTLKSIGETLQKKVVEKNPNLYLVLSGHRYAVDHLITRFDDDDDGNPDRTVYEMISNYQAFGDFGGDGYLRFLQIDEGEGTLTALSYSPVLSDYSMFDGAQQQEAFTLPLPWLETSQVSFPLPAA